MYMGTGQPAYPSQSAREWDCLEASRVSNRDELQECAREKVSVFLLRTTDTLRSMSWMFVPVI